MSNNIINKKQAKEQAILIILRFLLASDNNEKDAIMREGLAQAAIFVLREMVYETVKQTSHMSTSDIDCALKIDESIGGHKKWVVYGILNSLENENRVHSEKIDGKRQWYIAE